MKKIALTVSDLDCTLDRSIALYKRAMSGKKLSEPIIVNQDYDYLSGVFGWHSHYSKQENEHHFTYTYSIWS